MESKAVPGLYVIGEAVDVTGWLGGYNFQWAWSSGWAAGIGCVSRSLLSFRVAADTNEMRGAYPKRFEGV